MPGYPPLALQAGVEGSVTFELSVEGGRVRQISRAAGNPLLLEPSKRVARSWQFGDATNADVPVELRFTIGRSGQAGTARSALEYLPSGGVRVNVLGYRPPPVVLHERPRAGGRSGAGAGGRPPSTLAVRKSAPAACAPSLVGQAELPLYPAVAWGLGISGTVVVAVTVDGGGKASARIKSSSNQWLTAPTLANASTWRFQSGMPGSFDVTYTYRIRGTPTALPANPKVILALPCAVTVIARPVKPTRFNDPAGHSR